MYEEIILKVRKLMVNEGYDLTECLAVLCILQKNYVEKVMASDDDLGDDSEDDEVDEEDDSDDDELEDEDEMEKLVDDASPEDFDEEVPEVDGDLEPEMKEDYKVSIKRPSMGRNK